MKPWMEDFIRLCLAKIPDLPYRRRLAGELTDHLDSLSADLEAGGLTAQPVSYTHLDVYKRQASPWAPTCWRSIPPERK